MVCFDSGDAQFNYRVAGIALRDDQVLLNHTVHLLDIGR